MRSRRTIARQGTSPRGHGSGDLGAAAAHRGDGIGHAPEVILAAGEGGGVHRDRPAFEGIAREARVQVKVQVRDRVAVDLVVHLPGLEQGAERAGNGHRLAPERDHLVVRQHRRSRCCRATRASWPGSTATGGAETHVVSSSAITSSGWPFAQIGHRVSIADTGASIHSPRPGYRVAMRPRPRTTLIIAVIAQAAVSVVQFGLPAIGVDIQNKFGLGPAGFGAVFAAVGLGSAVALIPAGMLVDRFGARPVLVVGAAIDLCAYLAASVAPNAALFAAAIFVAGIGSSAVPVAGMSSLLREFPPERRGIALGWRQLAVPMGGAIGAAALPLLAHVGGVRLALIVTAFATASTASVFAWLSAAGGGTARRMRLDGALTARGMRPLLVVGLLYVYALGASLTYIVAAARDDGLGKAEAGALFVVLNLSAAASRLVWGRMADRGGGTRRVRTLIDCGMLAAVAGLAMARVLHVGLLVAVPVTGALGFGCFGWR